MRSDRSMTGWVRENGKNCHRPESIEERNAANGSDRDK